MAVLQSGHILALSAGFCAALASVFGKLAMDGGPTQVLRQPICSLLAADESDCQSQASAASQLSEKAVMGIRMALFCLVFVTNGFMWTLFSKSLALCTSSMEATVINSAANFLFTALMGMFLFGESLPLQWWLGFSLIITGLALVTTGAARVASDEKKNQ